MGVDKIASKLCVATSASLEARTSDKLKLVGIASDTATVPSVKLTACLVV